MEPTSRRDLLRLAPVSLAVPLLAQTRPATPREFRVAIPQTTIRRILTRVRQARWPDSLDAPDWRYGVNWNYMHALAQHWTTRFDWRKAEAGLNRYPQFMAKVEDFDIHFYHARGKGPNPVPLVLTHGWPGSVFEFQEAIGPLTDPASFGGSAQDCFDVIVPSLPGFGFSSKPKGKPIGTRTTARLWHRLLTEVLGYQKYAAQGGDWGYAVTVQLAADHPESLLGIHLNAAGGRALPEAQQSEEERAWQRLSNAQRTAEIDYFNEQQHKPQTVAFALYDNPLGAAAWIVEKLQGWSDSGDDLDKTLTKDQVLTNIMIYLVTDTMGTGVWFYRGPTEEGPAPPRGKIMTPTGFAAFPAEKAYLQPPRVALERDFNLVHYTKMPHGGHFGCLEQPKLFVEDVREFYRKIRV
jgi:pimeloyl-ACP methyl ester carboxylesterase